MAKSYGDGIDRHWKIYAFSIAVYKISLRLADRVF